MQRIEELSVTNSLKQPSKTLKRRSKSSGFSLACLLLVGVACCSLLISLASAHVSRSCMWCARGVLVERGAKTGRGGLIGHRCGDKTWPDAPSVGVCTWRLVVTWVLTRHLGHLVDTARALTSPSRISLCLCDCVCSGWCVTGGGGRRDCVKQCAQVAASSQVPLPLQPVCLAVFERTS